MLLRGGSHAGPETAEQSTRRQKHGTPGRASVRGERDSGLFPYSELGDASRAFSTDEVRCRYSFGSFSNSFGQRYSYGKAVLAA